MVPHTICLNTLIAYKKPKERRQSSRIIQADDLTEWHKDIPKKLTIICIEVISQNWIDCGQPVDLPLCSDSCLLLDLLPTNLQLDVSVLRINEDIYWKRAHAIRWPKNPPSTRHYTDVLEYRRNSNIYSSLSSIYTLSSTNVEDVSRRSSQITFDRKPIHKFDNKTWKEYYLERHLTETLENLQPEDYNPEEIKNISVLCMNYVTTLNLNQLKASTSSDNKDHIPLNAILSSLTRLHELSLCFKQTYVGENFNWHIFKTTPTDIKLLAQGIKKSQLTILKIQNSDIDCQKVVTIMKGLERNETIRVLDFSHCNISDRGVLAICKVIQEKNGMESLILINNDIGPKGAETLGYVIRKPTCKLKVLNLRLNEIGDDGGQYLITALVRDAVNLKSLIISGCGLTKKTENLGKMIAFNNTLETLDISNNRLEELIGQDILKGMEYNKTIISLDMRMCGIKQETERLIRTIIHENRCYIRLSMFHEKGIVKLRKVVEFKEFNEDEHKKLNISTRDFDKEMNEIFD